MKKFKEIREDISKEYEKIKELDKRIDETKKELYKLYGGLSILERCRKEKNDKDFANKNKELKSVITTCDVEKHNIELRIKFLNHNAKIALFHETIPFVLEVLSKYTGKAYGEKTKQKIRDEVIEKVNCTAYIDNRQTIYVNLLNEKGFNSGYNFACCIKSGAVNQCVLEKNRIQPLKIEDLEICDVKNGKYIEDIDFVISSLKTTHSEILRKRDELDSIFKKFNDMTVDGFSELYATYCNIDSVM